MNKNCDPYTLGREAFAAEKQRDPMKDQEFLKDIQTKYSAEHHPMSPGAELDKRGRKLLNQKILDWKRGWDDAHNE